MKGYQKIQEHLVLAAGYNIFAFPLAAEILVPIGLLLSPAVGDNSEHPVTTTN